MRCLKFFQRPWVALLLVLVIAAVPLACGGTADAPAATAAPTVAPTPTEVPPTSVPTAAPEAAGQTFSFPAMPAWVANGKYQPMIFQGINGTNPGHWDVHSCGSLASCLTPSSLQFNGLVYHDPNDPIELICDLCESWEVSADGMAYTFKLREANWHDGRAVTAEDIKFSLDRIVDPDAIRSRTGAMKTFYEPGTAEVVDDLTVTVPINFPGPLFIINLSSEYMKMYPKHATENLTPDEATSAGQLVGSGAWKLKNFEPQASIEYERNTDYFKEGLPFFDGMLFTIVRDFNRRLAALQVGQAYSTAGPMIGSYGVADTLQVQAETDGRVRALLKPDAFTTSVILHTNKPPFDDPRMRRAAFLAIDREELNEIVRCKGNFGCLGSPQTFLPRIGGFDAEPRDELSQIPGWRSPKAPDIAEAKQLAAEAGYGDGMDIEMNISSSATSVAIAEVVSDQLRQQLKLDITINAQDRASFGPRLLGGIDHLSLASSSPLIPDPSDFLNQHYITNTVKNPENWEDPRLTEIMREQAEERDPAKRLDLFREAVKILRKGESHWVPGVWGYSGGLMDYRLQGYNVPELDQTVKHWEATWWDPDVVKPPCASGALEGYSC